MDALNEFLIIFTISTLFFSIFCFIDSINLNEYTIQTKDTNTSNCYNLTFKETIICLNEFIKSIYNYTVRNDTIKSLEDIKLNGGDCFDYANLYKQLANERGFNAEHIGIRTNKKAHGFAIIYNENLSYCVLDQKSIIGCFN